MRRQQSERSKIQKIEMDWNSFSSSACLFNCLYELNLWYATRLVGWTSNYEDGSENYEVDIKIYTFQDKFRIYLVKREGVGYFRLNKVIFQRFNLSFQKS